MMPSQKKGIVHSIIDTEITEVSSLLPGLLPVTTPINMPIIAVMIVERPTKKSVQGRYSIITVKTGVG